jgi:hypothetical protein
MSTTANDAQIAIKVLEQLFISCSADSYEAGCISCEALRIRDILDTMVKEGDLNDDPKPAK